MAAAAADDFRPLKRAHSLELLPPDMSELRVVLLGNSWSERSSVGNFILRQPAFDPKEEPDHCLRERQIKEKHVVLINTPDLIHGDISEDKLKEHVDTCMRLSKPGPHVFLLVLQPEDFTEEQKLKLCRVLELFNPQSFNQSLLVISAPRMKIPGSPQKLIPDQPLKDMIVMCRYRYLRRENTDLPELLTRLGQTAVESSREHGSSSDLDVADEGLIKKPKSDTEHMKPVLNLVLCGLTAVAGTILGGADPHPVSSSSERVKHQVCGRWVSLVELPALSSRSLDDVMEESLRCVSLFDPEGVHVFILVLPVGPLTDEDKKEFETIMNTFGSQVKAFTMILFTKEADRLGPEVFYHLQKDKDIQELTEICRGRHFILNIRDRQQIPELLDSLEKHRAETEHEAASYTTETFAQAQIEKIIQQAELKNLKQSSTTALKSMIPFPSISLTTSLRWKRWQKESPKENIKNLSPELRIVLFGKDEIQKNKLQDFLILGTDLDSLDLQPVRHCSVFHTAWEENRLTVVKTPDMFHLQKDALIQEMRRCVSLCPPGPNVLLLLANPSDFTEENRQTLKFILRLFKQDAFKHLMIINTHKGIDSKLPLYKVFRKCGEKIYNMADEDHSMLMGHIESIAHANNQYFLKLDEKSIRSEHMRTPLNIVLCGSRRAEKTSAAGAILGRSDLHVVTSTSECFKLQAEGRQVSLVELPELYGRPLETVMKVSLSSVSLCDPEGVHVFILVLPVGQLTEEDKKEFETIMNTFGSQVKPFTMTLFTVQADPSAPAVLNYMKKDKDIQELIQSCKGHFVLNIRDRQQIPELLDSLEKHRAETEHEAVSYTTETFAQAQIEKISIQQAELMDLKQSSKSDGDMVQSPESLRIVLLGKTGSGKSSSGNTILRREEFEAEVGQMSVTRYCQKEHGEVNGRPVTVVDTPGLFDTALSHDEVFKEMIECMNLLAPGPHVFLLVVNIGRFTEEEKMTLERIKKGFGGNAEKFTIVLLTGGDQLKRKKMTIDEYIERKCTVSFKKMIADCGGRYHLFDNLDDNNQTQVSELITKIDEMVKENGGSCYTNEMLQEAEAAIKKQMEKLLKEKEEEMRKEMEELKMKHEEEMKAMDREMQEQRAETEKQRKLREKELKDMKKNLNKEREEREKEQKRREEEERKRKEQEENQSEEMTQKLVDLEKQIQIKSEEKQMTDRELLETREKLQQQQENFEKQLKDWWEDRNRENEQIRQEEQTKLKKLEEEYKREKENDEKNRKEEDKLRQQEEEREKKAMEEEYERKIEEQRAETENQRKLREKQLEDMEQKINKEQEEREKEQKGREEEERKRKEQEEIQRQELRQKIADSEKQIQIKSEEKQMTDRELQKTREELHRERDNFEKQLREWWEDRNRENEQIRNKEQTKLKKLQEEYKREKENDKRKRKEEDRLRLRKEERGRKAMEEEYERKMELQRAESEKQRKLREKQLEDMEQNLNKEREEREKDQKRREEEERRRKEQEENQRQELRQNLADLVKQIQIKSEEKQTIVRELQEAREELQRQQANFEKQLTDRNRENEQIRHEEQTKLKKLEEKYKREKENDEKKRKEEDQLRQQQEEQLRKTMVEEHERKIEELKKKFEEEARKKAEEFNDFKEKYEALQKSHESEKKDKDEKYDLLKALLEFKEQQLKTKHQAVINDVVKSVTKRRGNLSKIRSLLEKHEGELKKEKTEDGKKVLVDNHDREISDLLQKLLAEEDKWCPIL